MAQQASHKKILLFANTAWYLFNFRLDLAKTLAAEGWEVVFMAPPDQYVSRLESYGFRVLVIDMDRRNLNPFTELFLVGSLISRLRAEAPNVILNFTIKCVVYGSIAAKLAGVTRIVNAVAGLGSVFSNSSWKAKTLKSALLPILKLSLSGANNRLIVQNPDDEKLFEQYKLIRPGHMVLIKGSGVSKDRFSSKPSPIDQLQQTKRILFASRLLKSKGIYQFIQSAKELAQDSSYQFLVAGSPDQGNPESISLQELTHWHEQGIVTCLGHVEDMALQLASVDLVVLPSTYGEGVPRILIEAAASSLPLVAYDIPGSREIVLDGKNGYLIARHQPETLTVAIERIFEHPERYYQFCANSRHHFLAEFELNAVLDQTLAVIEATAVID